ncbi:unnamed protein product [Nezara viridula]|uniref:Uncharacterized protein n=1 Tax=Nezara viridula TaxID=85310 RepID=A0A9P0E6H8_NEZVI|nr:unnamed protein product [Nezara viridula]
MYSVVAHQNYGRGDRRKGQQQQQQQGAQGQQQEPQGSAHRVHHHHHHRHSLGSRLIGFIRRRLNPEPARYNLSLMTL